MAIVANVAPIEYQSWPQGDMRDPLGIWGCRIAVTGDASGNPITVTVRVPPEKRSAYVYTCYGLQVSQLTGTITAAVIRARLLTNWPNVDPQAGVQAFATAQFGRLDGSANFGTQVAGPDSNTGGGIGLLAPADRFILLYDPRQPATLGPLDIIETALSINTDLATYSFEWYGYFWDRSVMQAPGGPRHPGST